MFIVTEYAALSLLFSYILEVVSISEESTFLDCFESTQNSKPFDQWLHST